MVYALAALALAAAEPQLLAPQADSRLRGQVTLAAEMSGPGEAVFYFDDRVLGTVGRAPYQLTLDTDAMAPGAHLLWVEAIDPAGKRVKGAPTAVVIDNTSETGCAATPGVFAALGLLALLRRRG